MSAEATPVFHLEDSRSMRLTVEAVLTDEGFDYFGTEAWAEVSERIFKLRGRRVVLLADLNMPGIRGEDFCRTVLRHCPNVIVILHSGSGEIMRQAAAELGCRFVGKDEGPERLVAVIREALSS